MIGTKCRRDPVGESWVRVEEKSEGAERTHLRGGEGDA